MPKSDEQAPTGEWKMANAKLIQMLGHFVQAWSLIESSMEVCIGKQLGLPPLETSIITSGLMFRARASILMSLLNRDPSKNREAIRILKQIQSIEDRNDIMHSVIGGSENEIWFNRRKTTKKFDSKIERYSQIRMNSLALSVSDLAGELMRSLGVSKSEYIHFFQESHNATTSSERNLRTS